jgi:Molecular chaperone GrpE (heat shock protein)
MVNPRKQCVFTAEERKQMILDSLQSIDASNVKVFSGTGLTVDMAREHVDGVEPGTVTQVLQKGYKLNDRIVRAAMVKVSE